MKAKIICQHCKQEIESGHEIKHGHLCDKCYYEAFVSSLDEQDSREKRNRRFTEERQ